MAEASETPTDVPPKATSFPLAVPKPHLTGPHPGGSHLLLHSIGVCKGLLGPSTPAPNRSPPLLSHLARVRRRERKWGLSLLEPLQQPLPQSSRASPCPTHLPSRLACSLSSLCALLVACFTVSTIRPFLHLAELSPVPVRMNLLVPRQEWPRLVLTLPYSQDSS